jgi:hypothetical protein
MKYIILIIILLLFIFLILFINKCKKNAIKKVLNETKEEKITSINTFLKPFGFAYDLKQDIIVSKNNSWQRNFGYTNIYDLKAPYFHMVMDSEPIYFDYNHKHYRIEFWKGQYGITTGAEVGVYVRDFNSTLPNSFYRSASNSEALDISFDLYKNCYLLSRKNYSWWLTGFKVGTFSKPKDLKMIISIRFPNQVIKNAYIKGLFNAGYNETNIKIFENVVTVEYCCPNNYKLNNNHHLIKWLSQISNQLNCKIYNYLTRYFNTTLDKLIYLKYLAPFIYNFIVNKYI